MKKIRRKCKCGCGEITNSGRMYICGHNANRRGIKHTAETIKKMSETAKNMSDETKGKISKANKGKKRSVEAKLNISLGHMKDNPDNPYCDVWKDREYRKDIRKDYCENADCNKDYKQLGNHHIYLDKKRCAPNDIMTMCQSCHMFLHRKLQRDTKPAGPKDFVIINRPDHVSYIHKKSHKVIRINKKG